jgi:hypothetical protein
VHGARVSLPASRAATAEAQPLRMKRNQGARGARSGPPPITNYY